MSPQPNHWDHSPKTRCREQKKLRQKRPEWKLGTIYSAESRASEIDAAMDIISSLLKDKGVFAKLNSCSASIGTRCKCAWGTSIPKTIDPIRLQGTAFLSAFATR